MAGPWPVGVENVPGLVGVDNVLGLVVNRIIIIIKYIMPVRGQ